MTAEELLERYAAGERNFAGARLRTIGRELAGAYLEGINLSDSLLRGDLSGIYLREANLRGTRFGGTLNGANLNDANLSNTDFCCDMRGVTFNRAILVEACIPECDLSGAFLGGADLSRCTLVQSNLSGVCMSLANLSNAYLEEAFGPVDYTEANLTGVVGLSTYQCRFLRTTMPDGSIRTDA